MKQSVRSILALVLFCGFAWLDGSTRLSAAPDDPPVQTPLIETVTSEVVLIEVYATDPKGRTIKDLKPSDLLLKIDQQTKPKTITALEYVELPIEPGGPLGAPPDGAGASTADAGPSGSAPEAPQAARPRFPRRFLLFFEDSTSSNSGMTMARRAAETFLLTSGQSDDQFALATYDDKRKITVLHDFTAERSSLMAALDQSIKDVNRLNDYQTTQEERHDAIRDAERAAAMSGVGGQQATSLRGAFTREDFKLMRRVLDAVKVLIDSLAPWPGYKALVFMGDGIPENPGNEYGLEEDRNSLKSDIGNLGMAAAASNVTLHTVRTAGLVAGDARTVRMASRRSDSLASLALGTGGVRVDSNDLSGALSHVEAETRGYYILTYIPEGPPDGLHHSINVKTVRKGVTVRYRGSFVRLLPEQARERAIQAAYLAPELHADLGLDSAAVPGPAGPSGQVFDLVVYVPPGRVLFLPEPGGAAARLEVGLVAIDASGRETLRLARRVRVSVDAQRATSGGPLAIDFFTRVTLPAASHTLTAVVADVQSAAVGAARIQVVAGAAGATPVVGLSLYSMDEKSLWVEIDPKGDTGRAEQNLGSIVGPALRSRFLSGEKVRCGFKAPGRTGDAARELRLAILRDDTLVTVQPIGTAGAGGSSSGRPTDGMVGALVPLQGLAAGHYQLRVDEMLEGGPAELARLPFRVLPNPPRGRS